MKKDLNKRLRELRAINFYNKIKVSGDYYENNFRHQKDRKERCRIIYNIGVAAIKFRNINR